MEPIIEPEKEPEKIWIYKSNKSLKQIVLMRYKNRQHYRQLFLRKLVKKRSLFTMRIEKAILTVVCAMDVKNQIIVNKRNFLTKI